MAELAVPAGLLGLRIPRLRFHAVVALIIAGFMVLGFGYEVPKYVLHPTVHRPALLLVHSIVFLGWMVLYLVQTLLISARNVRLHRTLGIIGVALAMVMPPLGVETALVMRKFDLIAFHSHNLAWDTAFLATTLADMLAFTPCAWLGILWRKRPDYHRRLMFLSIACIAEAGFGRLPIHGLDVWFYLGNLPIFAAGMIHDRLTIGRIHPVYLWMVPYIVAVETIAMALWLAHPAWWVAACSWMMGM